DPRARGCNGLIREGATLVEYAADVLAVLSPMLGHDFREPAGATPAAPPTVGEGEVERGREKVLEAMGPAPIEGDELIRQTGAPAAAVLTAILELELAGRCVRQPGNRVCWP